MKITRNPHKIAITEEMIPIVVGNEEIRMVRVTVDGCLASCFLHDRVWYTTKVVGVRRVLRRPEEYSGDL